MVERPWRLLVSARDYGAAVGIRELARVAIADKRFRMHIVADEPAASYLAAHDVSFEQVCLGSVRDMSAADTLLKSAQELLASWPCDALLASLSGPGAGIDEALLKVASTLPTFALQDYWGDVNQVLGQPAGTYLVVDSCAAKITQARSESRAVVVGSVKHCRMDQYNVMMLRKRFRDKLNIKGNQSVAVVFGQPLWDVGGYRETLAEFAEALHKSAPETLCLYRSHPAEQRELLRLWKDTRDVNWSDPPGGPLEEALCGADLVVSVFSSCGLDQLMLSRNSSRPLGTVIYLLHEPRIRQFVGEYTGLDYIPAAAAGCALEARAGTDLKHLISEALEQNCRTALWQKTREKIPNPTDAPMRVLDAVAAGISK